jgi:hypothetical protein
LSKTVVCPCHDVTVADLVRLFAEGYRDPETLKRSSGAFMGPCQGKFCAPAVLAVIASLTGDDPARPPTARRPTSRPPLVPVPIGLLAGAADRERGQKQP